ncbi:glycerophosphodiester phosphodiesterase family protein [Nocardioides marmorisolisilvae]|uniref:Glycerophosphodiester phosphodiesterase n=1 Tax=Nocardioides marmorisolisilvae TaxID=1542737 RepID=A0A3N0DUN3_9ACTN|nr:glycerophosphodiester phosphodiesterase family protein [Nocardioides marmorisolisilvae]RNL79337.1 glycerophosphodiester phosphodiesterase [Nocardioides marmorisolisilvae]
MGRPTTGFAYLDGAAPVIAFAHRGGAEHPDLIGLENTAHAFRHAVALGYRYLETDVHLTADGRLVAFHDEVLDRMTDAAGPIVTASREVLDGARIAGEHALPLMADLLDEFPEARFNIDLKSPGSGPALIELVEARNAFDRICVGAFSLERMHEFRRLARGRIATAATPVEVVAFLQPSARLARLLTRGQVSALQVPPQRNGLPIVTASFVRRVHAAGAQVHVWTIDEESEMHRLLDLGVDGIFTDRTDLLKAVLTERGQWQDRS